MSHVEVNALAKVSGFQVGQSPVRHLGMPLLSKKLSSSDCKYLVDKITGKIQCWSSKYLSYAGRMQPINSIIYSMFNFWSQHFILPSKVIKKVQCLCSTFLWKGSIAGSRGAKVSWTEMCFPKSEGGLGFRNLTLWNKT